VDEYEALDEVWNIREEEADRLREMDFLFDWCALLLASRRARAAGVSDADLSNEAADMLDLDRELQTESSSFSLTPFLDLLLPAAWYVFALFERPCSALRAIVSLSVSSTTSKAGPADIPPTSAPTVKEAGRVGSQSEADKA